MVKYMTARSILLLVSGMTMVSTSTSLVGCDDAVMSHMSPSASASAAAAAVAAAARSSASTFKTCTYHVSLLVISLRARTLIFSARCNIYISRLCYDVSVRLSVRLSVTEVHWRIIANLGFKFWSTFTANCGRGACRGGEEGSSPGRVDGSSRAMLATARLSCTSTHTAQAEFTPSAWRCDKFNDSVD